MKIAINTISWGNTLANIAKVLDMIALAGYHGVEFAQRPDSLGVKNIEELKKLLDERNLKLLTIVGGTLKERVGFCDTVHPEYLHAEHKDLPHVNYALEKGFIVAFHPRVYTPRGRYEDILELARKENELKFIIDLAHVAITGNDPIQLIQMLFDKIVAVHLKDWKPDYGHSYYRFTRGFTTLGNGEAKLIPATNELQKRNFNGWLVAELDNDRESLYDSVVGNANWLRRHNLMDKKSELNNIELAFKQPLELSRKTTNTFSESESAFRAELMEAITLAPEEFYISVARAYSHLYDCKLIRIITCNSSEYVTLRTNYPDIELGAESLVDFQDSLTDIAIARQAIFTCFDLREEYPGTKYGYPNRRFGVPKLLIEKHLTSMISVPIFNPGNQNAVRLVVNLFPNDDNLNIHDDDISIYNRAVTQASDAMIDGHCLSAVEKVNLLANEFIDAIDFLARIRILIQDTLDCEGVAIFLVNETEDKLQLEPRLTTGTEWSVSKDKQFYSKGEGFTGRTWERNEALILNPRHVRNSGYGKSTEIVEHPEHNVNLWVPFLNPKREVIGVIRCRNKRESRSTQHLGMFSNDDAAILDAIVQAATPHYHIRQSDLQFSKRALQMDKAVSAAREAGYLSSEEDLEHTTKEMLATIYETLKDYFQTKSDKKDKLINQTLQVIQKYHDEVSSRLVSINYRSVNINYVIQENLNHFKNFQDIYFDIHFENELPHIEAILSEISDITFNLISNAVRAVKMSETQGGIISIVTKVEPQKDEEFIIITVSDTGVGIPKENDKSIYLPRFTTTQHFGGTGMGLFTVKRLVKKYYGEIRHNSTVGKGSTFEVIIPVSFHMD